jgi:hypothetical protein
MGWIFHGLSLIYCLLFDHQFIAPNYATRRSKGIRINAIDSETNRPATSRKYDVCHIQAKSNCGAVSHFKHKRPIPPFPRAMDSGRRMEMPEPWLKNHRSRHQEAHAAAKRPETLSLTTPAPTKIGIFRQALELGYFL